MWRISIPPILRPVRNDAHYHQRRSDMKNIAIKLLAGLGIIAVCMPPAHASTEQSRSPQPDTYVPGPYGC
jgi:hypothetical protein